MPTPVKKPVVHKKREKPPSIVLTSLECLHFVEKKDTSLRESDESKIPPKQGKGGKGGNLRRVKTEMRK